MYTYSYYPPIDSVEALSSANMEWGANSDAWLYSLAAAEEASFKTLDI